MKTRVIAINGVIKLKVLFAFMVLISILLSFAHAQSVGDYRSKVNGNWATASSWETYNGASWDVATTYPGQNSGNYGVTIQTGHNISIPNTGISTAEMGVVTISGTLTLNGGATSAVNFGLNTMQIYITPWLSPAATIMFIDKCNLLLDTDAIIKVWLLGLSGDCNNNQEIKIGGNTYAVCNGAPGNIFTFAELMAGGGTINAIVSPSTTDICLGETVNYAGSYSGAVVGAPTYSWTSSGPGALTFSPSSTSQNVSVTPTIAGSYSVNLTVTTYNEGTPYNNTERVALTVNQKSSNPTSAVAGTNPLMLGTSTTLALQGGGGGTNETIRWYTGSCGGTLVGIGNNLSVSPTVETTYYGRYENSAPCSYVTNCAQVTIQIIPFSNIWKGGISEDFATAGNWLNNTVPLPGQHIVFDANPINHCVLDSDRTIGDYTNTSAKDLRTSGHTLSINGTIEYAGSGKIVANTAMSTVAFKGSVTQTLPVAAFKDNTIETLDVDNSSGLNLAGDLIVSTNLSLDNGALNIGSNTLTINGVITKTTGALNGGVASNIVIGGSGVSTTLPTLSLKDLTLNRTNGVELGGDLTITGTLSLTEGILLVTNNSLTMAGNSPVRTNGSINASNSSALVSFSNSISMTLPAFLFVGNINNLTMNGIGGVTISDDISISSTLQFNAGIIYTGSNKVIMNNTSNAAIGAGDGKYIDGYCRKIGNTAFTFPVGNNEQYAPIGISAADGGGSETDSFTANYYYTMPHPTYDSTQHDASIYQVSEMEYWNLERAGTNQVSVTLSYGPRSGTINNPAELTVAHWDGVAWRNIGNTSAGAKIETITSNIVDSFSPFTLATTSKGVNLLPISLISFEGICADKQILLTWVTASETNNDYFELQSSKDANNWQSLAIIDGVGNSTQNNSYSFLTDQTESYFRLKQVDFDGKFEYSEIIHVERCNEIISEISISPNPSNGIVNLKYSGDKNEINSIDIYNLFGEKIDSFNSYVSSINMSDKPTGIYYVQVNMKSQSLIEKVVLNK